MSKSLIYFYGNQAVLSVGENATPIPKATSVAIQKLEGQLEAATDWMMNCYPQSICEYTRDTAIEMYTPECCLNADEYPDRSVHEEDMFPWVYCPFCSHEIRAYTDGVEEPDWQGE